MTIDPHAIDGKIPPAETEHDVIVVGAGEAGVAAALDAAKANQSVLLVDENPLPGGLIGTDVPLFFGGRMTAATQNSARMVEQVLAARPALEQAFEAGIDVRLGTMAWGLYANGPAMRCMPYPQLGLADAEHACMARFGRLVLATGARDVPLAFPGWNVPGVMGAQGLAALLTVYDAFAGRRILILGAGELGLRTALLAHSRGVAVAGIIEVAERITAPAELAEAVGAAGIPVHLNAVIGGVRSGIDGVESATILDRRGGLAMDVACDTVCWAIATQPATELLEAAGIAPGDAISLVGDCAAAATGMDAVAAWAKALADVQTGETVICQCEEVSRDDLIGVQPPRYLGRPPAMIARSLASLLQDGPAHPDQIKRLTRAGMGPCQGRRCRTQVACLLGAETGVPFERVPTASYRAPVRPVPLALLADWAERSTMADGWDVWFGIPTQWVPYADIGTEREAAHLDVNMHV